MLKTMTIFAATAIFSMPAFAEPQRLTEGELDLISAGTYDPCPPPTVYKGNNGWGNGAEGINNGSFRGKTSLSKITESSIPGGGVNQAPHSKFTGR